ncbi:MAG: helix-turn-helix transcriptional regulator [Geminicoccaceae bacterium]
MPGPGDTLDDLLAAIDDSLRSIESRLAKIAAAHFGADPDRGSPEPEDVDGSSRTGAAHAAPGASRPTSAPSPRDVQVVLTPDQIRTARRLLRWGQVELAEAAGLSRRSVIKLEAGRPCAVSTRQAVEAALRKAGVQFGDGAPFGATRDGRQPDMRAAQVRSARRVLGWTQEDLARAAALSTGVIRKLERGDHCLPQTHAAVTRALNQAGVALGADGTVEARRSRDEERRARA